MRTPGVDRVLELAELAVARSDPSRLRWMWGDALFLWALGELDAGFGVEGAEALLAAYCSRFAARPPRIDQSDTAAPGLVAWSLYRREGNPACRALAERVIAYIRDEPRLVGEGMNHLGHSSIGRFYPTSIWVDSLMMVGVFAARYAAETGDAALLDFAGRQPALYASLLQDAGTGLFRHSYWSRRRRAYPDAPLFWGRGNGWVVASLPLILGYLPSNHPERPRILEVLGTTSAALLPLQRADGYWDTLLGEGGAGPSNYREASATALIAAGWMNAAREAWLDERYAAAGIRAFEALVAGLGPSGFPPCLREVSAPTIPLPVLPRLGYSLVPRRADLPYGLAALFLAAIARERLGSKGGPETPAHSPGPA